MLRYPFFISSLPVFSRQLASSPRTAPFNFGASVYYAVFARKASRPRDTLQLMHTNALPPGLEKATVIPRDEHSVSRRHISENALSVLRKLDDAGYQGYLVGGGVRDLLLGKRPKDFDIATDATPEELRSLFRNSRIIGRRFKIVHLRYGREIIEATTFRAPHDVNVELGENSSRRGIRHLDSAHSTAGMILRDNVYGNVDEDALRRDFTVNALYYTTTNFSILDFSTGMQDLKNRKIRMIGDPEARYKEDPVRMLRALRFSAKLDFDIEEKTLAPINELAYLLESISPARLFDETIKLLASGQAEATWELLRKYQPGNYLFAPTLRALLTPFRGREQAAELLQLALRNTDNRLADGKSVTPAFLYAALLWPVIQLKLALHPLPKLNPGQQLNAAANSAIAEQLTYTSIPKRFTQVSKEIWELQARLEQRNRRAVEGVFEHPRFRAAYDFLLLREEGGENLGGIGAWWTEFQEAGEDEREALLDQLPREQRPRRKTRRRKPQS